MINNYWIYDIELMDKLEPYLLVCLKNRDTKEKLKFEISQWKDEREELIKFLKSGIRLIGFNCLNYDSQIIQWILKKPKFNRKDLYDFGQKVISSEWPIYPEWELSIPNLDLFKIHHFDNESRRCGLKWIQFSIDWSNIEDLPYKHYESIDLEKVKVIEQYCWNDIDSTEAFYWITKGITELPVYKGKDMIQLRMDIGNEFNLKCMNYSDSKIGDEFIKDYYCKQEGLKKNELPKGTLRDSIKAKDCLITPIEFKSQELKGLYEKISNLTFNPARPKDISETIVYKDIKISYGGGGIHTEDPPRLIESKDGYTLTDVDVSGYYPAKIKNKRLKPVHLTYSWTDGVAYFYDTRLTKWKPLAKKDKKAATYSEAFKLAGNSAYGKTNSKHSWACDPLVTYTITLDNQFLLLKLCEDLYEAGIQVVTLNTDGLTTYLHDSQKELMQKITDDWCKWTSFELEWTYYSKYVQTSVNDYIAIKTDGSVKEKGDFLIDREVYKNKSKRIVPIALKEYFLNRVPIEDTINKHSDIFDFCIGMKSKTTEKSGEGKFYLLDKNGNKTELSKTIRFFISNKGHNLIKEDDGGQSIIITHPLKGKTFYKTVLNKCYDNNAFNYDINRDYYIIETRKIQRQIESGQLKMF